MKNQLKKTLQILVFSLFATSSLLAQSSNFKKREAYQTLSQIWELDSTNNRETFLLSTHRPMYVLPVRFSSHRRKVPFEIPIENPTENELELDNVETIMQFSFKTKIAKKIWGEGALWLGYTQKSYWQVYNAKFSRPFRETNYEPEIIFNYPVQFTLLGLKTKMLGFGFNHQSNGREGAEFSRSWNRFIVYAGFEDTYWNLVIRTWMGAELDENPAIENYMGRADATFNYRIKNHLLTLHAQHSLRTGNANRGNVELDWAFPIFGNLSGYFQFFHGYGDAMIDYNQRHTIGGLGLVFSGTL